MGEAKYLGCPRFEAPNEGKTAVSNDTTKISGKTAIAKYPATAIPAATAEAGTAAKASSAAKTASGTAAEATAASRKT